MSDDKTPPKAAKRTDDEIIEMVRKRYAGFAKKGTSCCGPATDSCCDASAPIALALGYDAVDLDFLPDGADLGLGCGAPLRHLALEPGETVVDLGSGAGIDALIAARSVGPSGTVIGVDMTSEMLAKARGNAAAYSNVEFREGRLEDLPIESGIVDAVTSNCVINLVPDKARVFREIARILRPGGRLVISDIVLDGTLPESIRSSVLAYVGCVAGAMERSTYFAALEHAGLRDVEIIKDVDFIALTAQAAPAEVSSVVAGTGIDIAEIEGIVRSVTYRAVKKAPGRRPSR